MTLDSVAFRTHVLGAKVRAGSTGVDQVLGLLLFNDGAADESYTVSGPDVLLF